MHPKIARLRVVARSGGIGCEGFPREFQSFPAPFQSFTPVRRGFSLKGRGFSQKAPVSGEQMLAVLYAELFFDERLHRLRICFAAGGLHDLSDEPARH